MMRRTFAITCLFLFFLAGLFFAGCSTAPNAWPGGSGKRVLATFPPIYCFTQNVAGDDAVVVCLLTGKEPHHAEPDLQDKLKIDKADLIFANGLGIDDTFVDKLRAGKKVQLIKLGDALPKDRLLVNKEGKTDPHVWLDPELAMLMVDGVADELSKVDPAHEKGFHQRAKTYKEKIKTEVLDRGLAAFKQARTRNIITQHDAMEYFARAFDLKIIGAVRNTEDEELTTKEREDLERAYKNTPIGAVTCEPGYRQREMQDLAKQLKTSVVVVDPLETASGNPNPDPNLYVSKMRENIDNLAEKLK